MLRTHDLAFYSSEMIMLCQLQPCDGICHVSCISVMEIYAMSVLNAGNVCCVIYGWVTGTSFVIHCSVMEILSPSGRD